MFDPAGRDVVSPTDAPVFVDVPTNLNTTRFYSICSTPPPPREHLLVATRTPPAQWEGRLPDLKSRLAPRRTSGQLPDETLIAAVMVKMFADQQMDVGADVLAYLINRMDRSFEARVLFGLNNAAGASGNYRAACPRCAETLESFGEKTEEACPRRSGVIFEAHAFQCGGDNPSTARRGHRSRSVRPVCPARPRIE